MATIPQAVSIPDGHTADILNATRNATPELAGAPDVVQGDVSTLSAFGQAVMSSKAATNSFISTLAGRIGLELYTGRSFQNPLRELKRGMLEWGEEIEEIFVNLAMPHQFDPAVAETKVFEREIPDVRTAFHPINSTVFYKQTISRAELTTAFLSFSAMDSLIGRIVERMYSAAYTDEYLLTKYVISKAYIDGRIKTLSIPAVNETNATAITRAVVKLSNDFTFNKSDFNHAGVTTSCPKNDQHLVLNTTLDALLNVDVLAFAFNMDKAEFAGKKNMVDTFTFSTSEMARLAALFEDDSTYVPFTAEQLAELETIPGVLIDREFSAIYDKLIEFDENYNGQGKYWNYFLHVWKIYSSSIFANAVAFVPTP